jgi:large subunit ribosomal protein L10
MDGPRVTSPRAEKVAVVDEVRERLSAASASVVTEYRGLSVAELAELRQSLSAVGGDYKVFKNTLVRRAVDGGEHQPLQTLLVGPTAIAFVHGDVSAVAKALRDFSRTKPNLVVKGGMLEGNLLSAAELTTLADLPPREVLLAQVAGAIAAPMRQLAGLMAAVPRNLAYGIAALVEQLGGVPAAEVAAEVAPTGEAPGPEPAAAADVGTAEEGAGAGAEEPETVTAETVTAEAVTAETVTDETVTDETVTD